MKICVYDSKGEFEFAIETTRGEIGSEKHTLFPANLRWDEQLGPWRVPQHKA